MKSMFSIAVLCFGLMTVGCGRSGDAAPMADQDEIARYAMEHPEEKKTYPEGEL